jgi:hypothetical protein
MLNGLVQNDHSDNPPLTDALRQIADRMNAIARGVDEVRTGR